MKCVNCGSALHIEHRVCPNCGTANPHFQAHRADMEKYNKAFENTQKAVIDKTKKHTGILIKIIVLAVLIALTATCFIVSVNSYSIYRSRLSREHKKNAAKYVAIVKEFEDERRYMDFAAWWENNYSYRDDVLDEYLACARVSSYYESIFRSVASIADSEYIANYSYLSVDSWCIDIAGDYCQMLKAATLDGRDYNNEYTKEHREYMDDCIEEARKLLNATFRFTDDELLNIDPSAEARLAVLLADNWPYSTEE